MMTRDEIVVDGRRRTFAVVGEPDGPAGRDLVLVFHGSRQSGEKHRAFTGRIFDALAADGAAVVAYLDGYRRNWNDARRESRFPARLEGVDDVGSARAVIARLAQTHAIDRDRVLAVGYSNGGQMVMRLLHEAPELLSGGVVIAATRPAAESFLLPDTDPVPRPVLLIHGTRDPIVSYRGGTMSWWARTLFKVGGRSLSAPETAAYYAARNGITAEPVGTVLPRRPASDGKTSVERTEYRQDGREPVVLYTVHGGGHTVPGPAKAPFVVGRTALDVDTAELVARFFGVSATAP
jgi:polyhydroxybutyrate depolymerase